MKAFPMNFILKALNVIDLKLIITESLFIYIYNIYSTQDKKILLLNKKGFTPI